MYNPKRIFRDSENIKHFLDTYGVGEGKTAFLTITFNKRIYIKKEASRILNIWLTQMRKVFNFEYICITELHKTGAYHFHLLLKPVNFSSLNPFREYFKSLPFIGQIQVKWTRGEKIDVMHYLMKYMLKGDLRKGERIINYSRNVQRKVSSQFSWAISKWRSFWNDFSRCFGRHKAVKVYYSLSYERKSRLIDYCLKGNYKSFSNNCKLYIENIFYELRNLKNDGDFLPDFEERAKHKFTEKPSAFSLSDIMSGFRGSLRFSPIYWNGHIDLPLVRAC